MLNLYFLKLNKSIGEGEEVIKRLGSIIQACWDMIPREFFDKLIISMPRRVEAYY
jgi:hypothetical protein